MTTTHSAVYESQLASRIAELRAQRMTIYEEMQAKFCPAGKEFEFSKFVDGLNYHTRRMTELQQLLHNVRREGGEV